MPELHSNPIQLLENSIFAALETYSNVHRGSGLFSIVSTNLFDKSRKIVADFLCLNPKQYELVFCSPRGSKHILSHLQCDDIKQISSYDLGLNLGVYALGIPKHCMKTKIPFLTGGGTTRMVSINRVIHAPAPDLFEPGTPSVINIVAFAKALQITKIHSVDVFRKSEFSKSHKPKDDSTDSYSGHELFELTQNSIIGRDLLVPTALGYRPYANLDHAASTPALSQVYKAFIANLLKNNETSDESILNQASKDCLEFVNADAKSYDVIFTSNTTESINIVAQFFNNLWVNDSSSVIITTNLEHSSNDLPWRDIQDASLIHLNIDSNGFFNLSELEALLENYNHNQVFGQKRIKLLCLSAASNVLGVYNNLHEISRLAHKYDVSVLLDAAQLVAHRPLDLKSLDFDFVAFSGHKMYAPFGTGVLIAKKKFTSQNLHYFSEAQKLGSENLAGISAICKSMKLLQRIGFDLIIKEESELTSTALDRLHSIQGMSIYGISDSSSANFSSKGGVIPFSFQKQMPKKVAIKLSEYGIGVRYGCHCAHITVKNILGIGKNLEKFQNLILVIFSKLQLQGVIRVSFGIGSTKEDIDLLINALNAASKYSKPLSESNRQAEISSDLLNSQMNRFVEDRINMVF